MFHLILKIIVGIKSQMIVKPFLITSVASLHLPVMPGRPWLNQFVRNI